MSLRRSQGQARQLAALTSYFYAKEHGEPSRSKLLKALDTSQGKRSQLSDFRVGRLSYTRFIQKIGI